MRMREGGRRIEGSWKDENERMILGGRGREEVRENEKKTEKRNNITKKH